MRIYHQMEREKAKTSRQKAQEAEKKAEIVLRGDLLSSLLLPNTLW